MSAVVLKEIGVAYAVAIAAGKWHSYLIIDGKKYQVPSDYSWVPSMNNQGDLVGLEGMQFFESLARIEFFTIKKRQGAGVVRLEYSR